MSYGGFDYTSGAGYGGYDQNDQNGGFGGFAGGMEGDGDMGGGGFDAAGGNTADKSAEKKSFKNKSCMAVTIKQIKSGKQEDQQVTIDNMTPEMVKIMGTIVTVIPSSTNIVYTINDGTSQIQAKMWVEAKEDESTQPFQAGDFVSVVGTVKIYNEELSLQIFHGGMKSLSDSNALTHHLLEVILTHNMNIKGPIPGSDAAKASLGNQAYNMGMGGSMMQSPAGPGVTRANNDSGLDEVLLKAIKFTGSNNVEGTTVDDTLEYLRKIGSTITREQVNEKVKLWYEDGLLYTMVDEQHFRSCDE